MAAGYRPEQLEVVVPRSDPNLTVVLKSLETKAMVVSQPYAEVRRSGPQPSGIGSNFSPWYELRSPPPKPGYELDPKTVQFSLSGDRRCNEWSECQIKQASANEVIFLFRLQGHNEWFPPRPAFSEGVLRVEFRPIDSSK